MMHVVVVGAGAVGGYFGVRLARAGAKVTFLVREKRSAQLQEHGLALQSPFGDDRLESPILATDVEQVQSPDLVLLSVKNYHLEGTMASLQVLAAGGARILPLLNGIEHVEQLSRRLGKEAVLGGLCQIIATLDESGHVVHSNQTHDLTFGPFLDTQVDFCKQVQDLFSKANMRSELSERILTEMWMKYAFITAFSGTTTASRLPIGEILAEAATRDVFVRTLQEMQAIAKGCGVLLPADFADMTVGRVSKLPSSSTSSMHQDYRKGLPLEVESLQGAAVRLATQVGLNVPTVQTLYGLLKPYEFGGKA